MIHVISMGLTKTQNRLHKNKLNLWNSFAHVKRSSLKNVKTGFGDISNRKMAGEQNMKCLFDSNFIKIWV